MNMTNITKRFAWLLLIMAVLCLYFPINQTMTGGYNLKTALDAYVPVVPIFAVPYLIFLPFWVAFFVVAAWKMNDGLFRSFILGSTAAITLATLIYIVFPTYTERPLVTGNSWAAQLLQAIYANDNVYNAFPSGHVLITTLIALFGARWYPELRKVWIGSVVLVVLATLFTGQHHLLDPLGGLGLGWSGYQFGLWMEWKSPSANHNLTLQNQKVSSIPQAVGQDLSINVNHRRTDKH
jgi:membrane-associated phospholipid phosphatase